MAIKEITGVANWLVIFIFCLQTAIDFSWGIFIIKCETNS
jgi:hypothetical protein